MSSTHVHVIDLKHLARATGCTERELSRGMARVSTTVTAAGAVAAPAERVIFTADSSHSSDHVLPSDRGIDVALISLAARPGVLDRDMPKCLLPLGSQPLIGHVLDQLVAGGITRLILVLGANGERIRNAVLALPVAQHCAIQFIDLGPTYARGFARSLLAAGPLLGSPEEQFLLCTPDHIFDASLVSELRASTYLGALDAIALVEENATSISGALPPTAVHVKLGPPASAAASPVGARPWRHVRAIGKQVPGADAIEAGIYRCNGTFFTVMSELRCARNRRRATAAAQPPPCDRPPPATAALHRYRSPSPPPPGRPLLLACLTHAAHPPAPLPRHPQCHAGLLHRRRVHATLRAGESAGCRVNGRAALDCTGDARPNGVDAAQCCGRRRPDALPVAGADGTRKHAFLIAAPRHERRRRRWCCVGSSHSQHPSRPSSVVAGDGLVGLPDGDGFVADVAASIGPTSRSGR